MIADANIVVEKLNLQEDSPITEAKLTTTFIDPPFLKQCDYTDAGGIGIIKSKRYLYSYGKEGKFYAVIRRDLFNFHKSDVERTAEYKHYAMPLSQIDTNAAWKAMLPYLRSGILNLDRLSKECQLNLADFVWGHMHVPIYSAEWTCGGETVAMLKILMPAGILLQLQVYDPRYNMRPSLDPTDPRYKGIVLTGMIKEANIAVEQWNLDEDKPITLGKLRYSFVCHPSYNEFTGGPIGNIATSNYWYLFHMQGKLTDIERIGRFADLSVSALKLTERQKEIAVPISEIDTNAAWNAILPVIRSGWLDLNKLNKSCEFQLDHLHRNNVHVPVYSARWTKNSEAVVTFSWLMPGGTLLALRIQNPEFSLCSGIEMNL